MSNIPQKRRSSDSDPASVYAECADTFMNHLIYDVQNAMDDDMRTLELPKASALNGPIGASSLINQPISDFQIAMDDSTDTKADKHYLLFGQSDNTIATDVTYSLSEKTDQTTFEERSGTAFRFAYKQDTENIIPDDSVGPNDILMGQGQTIRMRKHPGNVFFRDLVEKYFFRYDSSTSRVQKTKISKNVVMDIVKKNGRFLEPHKMVCEEVILSKRVGDLEARRKVAYTFRGIRKQKQRINRR